MQGDSRTANTLLSWGANVASAQRNAFDETHESQWRRVERFGSPSAEHDFSLQERCNRAAQRLVEETNDFQICEQILLDNDKEFGLREQELMQAVAEIQKQNSQIHSRPVLEEVRIREEALWHLESTLQRLEGEEDVQGQAMVAIADCVSCCQTADARSNLLISDAHIVLNRLMRSVQLFRETCVAPSIEGHAGRAVDGADFHTLRVESAQLWYVLLESLSGLAQRCTHLRSVAASRIDSLLDESSSLREACERQTLTVHGAHTAVDELRRRAEALVTEIESCVQTEHLLRHELAERSRLILSLETHSASQSELVDAQDRRASKLRSEHLSLTEEEANIRTTLDEQKGIRDGSVAARARVVTSLSDQQRAFHKVVSEGDAHSGATRDGAKRATSLEMEIDILRESLRKHNEDENEIITELQVLHSSILGLKSEMGGIKSSQKLLSSEISTQTKIFTERQSELLRAKETTAQLRASCAVSAAHLASQEKCVNEETFLASQLSATLVSLKQQLLDKQSSSVAQQTAEAPQWVSGLAPRPKDPHFVVSSLENVVSTAPLSQLLLSENTRAPWRVPLEPRHRYTGPSDALRDQLVSAFQL